jgi:hypothetical protein
MELEQDKSLMEKVLALTHRNSAVDSTANGSATMRALRDEEAARALSARVARALSSTVIEPCEGFHIWRHEAATKYNNNKNALLDYPGPSLLLLVWFCFSICFFFCFPFCFCPDLVENDVYFYRDNFMLDPRVYTEIEEGLKYFSPGTMR